MDFSGKGVCVCGKELYGSGGTISPNLSASWRNCSCGLKAIFYSIKEDMEIEVQARHKDQRKLDEELKDKLLSLFKLADIPVNQHWSIENGYYGNKADWLLAQTPLGLIKIGWRKRVINIDWSATGISYLIKDDVTKDKYFCHAWSYADAITYLSGLRDSARCKQENL